MASQLLELLFCPDVAVEEVSFPWEETIFRVARWTEIHDYRVNDYAKWFVTQANEMHDTQRSDDRPPGIPLT